MTGHYEDKTERNGTVVSGHTLIENTDAADSVDVDELVRQLSEMERVDEIQIENENGYFKSIAVMLNGDTLQDMISEVAYDHGLRYWHSNSASDGRHVVRFKTNIDVEMRAGTAYETYEEYGPPEENPMGEAYSLEG